MGEKEKTVVIHSTSYVDYYCNSLKFNYPRYFSMYFNIGAFFLLSPFCVFKNNGKSPVLKSLWIHMVLCGIWHIAFLISAALTTIHVFRTNSVKNNPKFIYTLFQQTMYVVYCVCILHVVWFKQSSIKALINIFPLSLSAWSCKIVLMGGILTISGAISAGLLYVAPILSASTVDLSANNQTYSSRWLDAQTKVAFAVYFLPTDEMEKLTFSSLFAWQKMLVILYRMAGFYVSLVYSFCQLLITISCVAAYEITTKYEKTIMKKLGAKNVTCKYSAEIVIELFTRMKMQLGRVNEVNGKLLVAVVILLISVGSGALIDVIDGSWYETLYMGYFYFIFIFTLILAAESNCKMRSIERKILNQHLKQENVKTFSCRDHLYMKNLFETTEGNFGISGGRFFTTITYSLLGTCCSILFTYSLVMLQFSATPKEPKCLCSCNNIPTE